MTTAMRAALCCLATMAQLTGGAIIFPRAVNLTIPVDFPLHMTFYQVVVIDDDTQSDQYWNFSISKVKLSAGTRRRRWVKEELFSINKESGEISLCRHFHNGTTKKTYDIEVKVNHQAKTTVSVKADGLMSDICQLKRELCFLTPLVKYRLPESLSVGTVFDHLLPIVPRNFCVYEVKYQTKNGESGPVSVDSVTGNLLLSTALDAENERETNFTIICHLKGEDDNKRDYLMEGIIQVEDINDNAPYYQQGAQYTYEVRASHVQPGKQFPKTFSVLDRDTKDVNKIEVRIEDDPSNFFFVKNNLPSAFTKDGLMYLYTEIGTRKYFKLTGSEYNFSVVFEDLGYIGDGDRKVVFFVHIDNSTRPELRLVPKDTYEGLLSSNATYHSRIIRPFDVEIEDGYEFKLETYNNERKIFGVTTKTGIVYLMNERALSSSTANIYYLILSWSKPGETGHTNVVINITEKDGTNREEHCDFPCSKFNDDETCASSCGVGSPTGNCYWQRNVKNDNSSESELSHDFVVLDVHKVPILTKRYQTCSPDIETCPDGNCDELERLDSHICPQDCTKEVTGEGLINSLTGVGIEKAMGICSCADIDSCICRSATANYTDVLETRDRLGDINIVRGNGKGKYKYSSRPTGYDPSRIGENGATTPFPTGNAACGKGCIAGIFLCVFGIIVFLVIGSIHCVKRWKIGRGKHKHVGSRVSLSAVLSNYVGERSPYLSDSQTNTETSGKSDLKWEFPRENLILGETLGEGEFGKVMRAQAWGINNTKGYTTVAVKMLKGDATISEQQDLLSEFNMLKEVSHPNVIRLLGACTTKGEPLYVIVEYAEYGSLRGYLRKSRNITFESLGTFHTVWNPTYILENEDMSQPTINSLSQRDLLSFAWQISKGMSYLSDMKLLHRDLAARNVLLAAGKVVKISDFGLSRDVYEGDTYLKKSKGRVPVKWMAIESLADNVYTTKSDVWSFGVVLWEIVTLGSSPYPGVTPERLFQLLKAGYRMEQPYNCSAELYKIMRMCWNESPHDRPSFKQLVQIFDRMLQDTAQYLSLRAVAPEEYTEWNNGESEESGNEDKVELTEKYCSVTSHDNENVLLLVDGEQTFEGQNNTVRTTET